MRQANVFAPAESARIAGHSANGSEWWWRGCGDDEQRAKCGLVAVPDDEQRKRGLGSRTIPPALALSHKNAESATSVDAIFILFPQT